MAAALFERGIELLETRKDYAEAIKTFRLATEVTPDRAGAFYYLAWAHAANGDKKKALENLRTAANKGFADAAAISNNQAFDGIKADPAVSVNPASNPYQELTSGIRRIVPTLVGLTEPQSPTKVGTLHTFRQSSFPFAMRTTQCDKVRHRNGP